VYSHDLVATVAEALVALGARRAFVVHGAEGIDELSPAGPNHVCEIHDGRITERTIDPRDLGIDRCAPSELNGGTPEDNAQSVHEVLSGVHGGKRDAVLLNAAGAIAAGGHAADLAEGIHLAAAAIDSGRAGDRLEELVAFSTSDQT
jgi:anthranilate phosphoribosyltransferase